MDLTRIAVNGLRKFLQISENLIAEGVEDKTIWGELRMTFYQMFDRMPEFDASNMTEEEEGAAHPNG